MDMDGEVERQLSQLAHRMDCMGTEDEETLVHHFQQILAPQADLSADTCRFFLDMNNWNLQAALGSFYDYNAQQMALHSAIPCMQFVADVTIGEGESVRPGSSFVKTLRVRNAGTERWPVGCCLRHVEGELFADTDHVEVEALEAGRTTDINLKMTSPANEGIFQSRWQMSTAVGLPFGDTIWCIVVVDNNGLLDLTQRLASTNCSISDGCVEGGQSTGREYSEEMFRLLTKEQQLHEGTNYNGDEGKPTSSANDISNLFQPGEPFDFGRFRETNYNSDEGKPTSSTSSNVQPGLPFDFAFSRPWSRELDDPSLELAPIQSGLCRRVGSLFPTSSSAFDDVVYVSASNPDLLSSISSPVPDTALPQSSAGADGINSLPSSFTSNTNVSNDMEN